MSACSIALALLLSTVAHAQFYSPQSTPIGRPSTPLASLSVNNSGSGITIPAGFVGLSSEVADFVNGFYQGVTGTWTSDGFTGNAASYVSLFHLLGATGSFRIGGGTAEVPIAPTITAGMSTKLNTFLAGLGANWKLIYGLDLKAADTATAATTAGNLATAIGKANITYQFGNEPSLDGFTAAQYETAWNSYYTAVAAAVSSPNVAAIDDEMNTSWGNPLTVANALTPTISGLSFLSQHWYSFCKGTWASPVPANLIQSIYANELSATVAGIGFFGAANNGAGYFLNNGQTGATPQRMSETNSICGGGQTGMSDRAMAAAWFLDLAMVLASNGWAGMNVHQGWPTGISIYNPAVIQPDGNFSPSPVFYGMYLFAQIEGEQILPMAIGGNANVAAIAAKGPSGNSDIIVVNNDPINSVSVTPAQSGTWTTATVLSLGTSDGAGCGSARPILGGQPIGESGVWSGGSFSLVAGASFSIPPCGAALVRIQ